MLVHPDSVNCYNLVHLNESREWPDDYIPEEEEDRRNTLDMEMKERGFTYIGAGRQRRTYMSKSGKYVLKFPRSISGALANIEEAWMYHIGERMDGNIARCRLILFKGMYCVMMEAVQYVDSHMNLRTGPYWLYEVDCLQVGYTRKGKLVAYDYPDR